MTNLWILKKRRARVGKLLREARDKKKGYSWIKRLETARSNLNEKIWDLRKKQKKKK